MTCCFVPSCDGEVQFTLTVTGNVNSEVAHRPMGPVKEAGQYDVIDGRK